MTRLPAGPEPLTEAEHRQLLRAVLWWSVGTSVVTAVLDAAATRSWGFLPLAAAALPFQLLALWALQRLSARLVGAVGLLGACAFLVAAAALGGGTASLGFFGLILVVQCTALLFGVRGLAVLAPLVVLLGGALAVLEQRGLLPTSIPRDPFQSLLPPMAAFVLSGAGSVVIHRQLTRAALQARAQAQVTAKANTQLSNEMQRRLEMEDELHASMERALEASRLKSSFLANVSHELRTPMNAVVGLTDLLLRDGPTDSQRDALETIRTSSEALLGLLDDILDLSKIESGVLQFESLATSAAAVVEEVRKLFAPKAEARGVGLRAELDPDLPLYVMTDPTRLRQVLVNLVGNAVKFTEAGEVVVRLSWANERLRVEVRDTGIGIDEAQRDTIFQPFVQADASTTRRFGGSGLGLTIVKRLVDAQGGSIEVASTPGRGSTFTIELPAPRAASRAGSRSSGNLPAASSAQLATLCVLLADDNPINEKVAVKLLEHLGVKPDVARNGREAVELAAERGYDLVLMDMQMPEMDGLEATRLLRARHGAELRIIAMTANAMPEDRARATEAGCDGFLAKPVRLEDLHRVLSRTRAPKRPAVA